MNSTKRVLPISVLHHTLCLDTHTQSILAQRSPACGERERGGKERSVSFLGPRSPSLYMRTSTGGREGLGTRLSFMPSWRSSRVISYLLHELALGVRSLDNGRINIVALAGGKITVT